MSDITSDDLEASELEKKANEVAETLNSIVWESYSFKNIRAKLMGASDGDAAEEKDESSFLATTIGQIHEVCDSLQEHAKNLQEAATRFQCLLLEQAKLKDKMKIEIINEAKQIIDDKIAKKMDSVDQRVRNLEQDQAETEEKVSAQDWKVKKVMKSLLISQWKNCSRSVVIDGIPQDVRGDGTLDKEEQWETKLRIEKEVLPALNLDGPVIIDSAKRLTRKLKTTVVKPEKILVQFRTTDMKNMVMSRLKNLKGKDFCKKWHFANEVPELLRPCKKAVNQILYQFRKKCPGNDTKFIFEGFKYTAQYRKKGQQKWISMTEHEMDLLMPERLKVADIERIWAIGGIGSFGRLGSKRKKC